MGRHKVNSVHRIRYKISALSELVDTKSILCIGSDTRDQLWPHCTKNQIYAFPEMKLRGLVPNSYSNVQLYIHVFVKRFIYTQIYECGNQATEQYNSVLQITRLRSFISGSTLIGTRHLYWILIGPSFAVRRVRYIRSALYPNGSM